MKEAASKEAASFISPCFERSVTNPGFGSIVFPTRYIGTIQSINQPLAPTLPPSFFPKDNLS